MRVSLVIAVLATTGLICSCGGGDRSASGEAAAALAVPWVDPDGDPPYIGSLSVNPRDGTLLMATNTGLFKIPAAGGKPKKITGELRTPEGKGEISEALVAEFTGPDELLASGHPSGDSTLPPALGLIRSADAGRTWESVSELGTSDFHALSVAGDLLVAALYGQAQLRVSRDGGERFEPRAAPMALVDLAADPEHPERLVAASDSGIYSSGDEGRRWRQRDATPNVRLAWRKRGELYRIDPGGPVKVSADGGQTWQNRGTTSGEPQALAIDEEGTLYAATLDGTVQKSDDGGRRWTVVVEP
jgi:photosystem II stability/assembly factor-like uncharacterized protein